MGLGEQRVQLRHFPPVRVALLGLLLPARLELVPQDGHQLLHPAQLRTVRGLEGGEHLRGGGQREGAFRPTGAPPC